MKGSWENRPAWFLPAVTTLAFILGVELFFYLVPAGEWLARRSDSILWGVAPWVLIVLFWIYIIQKLRRNARVTGPRITVDS